MHNSDVGFQGSSSRDARLRQFIADGPGVAGFSMKPNPEEDGDAFAASFDPFRRPENTETCFSEWDDDGRHLSLEALEGLGCEFGTDPNFAADDDRDEDEEGYRETILRGQFGAERFLVDEGVEQRRPGGTITAWRKPQRWQQVAKKVTTKVVDRKAELISLRHKAEEERKAAEAEKAAAKPEPRKGNGHKPATPAPVGKFLGGTVVDKGPKGLLVDIGDGLEARVPIALEMGHGNWEAAARWLLSFQRGSRVRLKVVRTNGHIEAVLSDRHPRPFWKKEAPQSAQAPAAN